VARRSPVSRSRAEVASLWPSPQFPPRGPTFVRVASGSDWRPHGVPGSGWLRDMGQHRRILVLSADACMATTPAACPGPLGEIRSPTDRNSATASLTRRQASGRLAERTSIPARLLARDGPKCLPCVRNSATRELYAANRGLARQVRSPGWPGRAMRVEAGASPDQLAANGDEFSRGNQRVDATHAPRTAAG